MDDTHMAKGHPKGLYVLFATEMWERFNFYGMRAILVLFMIKALLFNEVFAANLYGSYISLVYLTPLLGGYMADRYWGNRRSIIAGGIVMAIGELILFCCGTVYHSAPQLSLFLFFSGLGLMIAGNGFFKPNISIMVGQLYPKGDRRKDSAYTILYMGINTGECPSVAFVCGLVGDTGNPADFRWAFLVGCIGMILSVVTLRIFHRKYVVTPEKEVLGLTPPGCFRPHSEASCDRDRSDSFELLHHWSNLYRCKIIWLPQLFAGHRAPANRRNHIFRQEFVRQRKTACRSHLYRLLFCDFFLERL